MPSIPVAHKAVGIVVGAGRVVGSTSVVGGPEAYPCKPETVRIDSYVKR